MGTTDDTSTEPAEAGTGASRRHLEREVEQVRKDLKRQAGTISAHVGGITARVEKLVSNDQGLMS